MPSKSLTEAKSRLASVLTGAERAALALNLLHHTLTVLTGMSSLARVLVVSSDPAIWDVARRHRVAYLEEHDTPGLNVSLERARAHACEQGAQSLAVVPADLPYLSIDRLEAVIAAAGTPPTVVLVPDRHASGTNLLLLSPPALIPFRFGDRSLQQHTALAQEAGAHLQVVRDTALALDIDVPEDLLFLNACEGRSSSSHELP